MFRIRWHGGWGDIWHIEVIDKILDDFSKGLANNIESKTGTGLPPAYVRDALVDTVVEFVQQNKSDFMKFGSGINLLLPDSLRESIEKENLLLYTEQGMDGL